MRFDVYALHGKYEVRQTPHDGPPIESNSDDKILEVHDSCPFDRDTDRRIGATLAPEGIILGR